MIDVLKINTAQLEVGMYISSLDRPWLDAPFALQGFRIGSEADTDRLQDYCQYVYIDCQRSDQERAQLARKLSYRPRTKAGQIFLDRKLRTYQDSADWGGEYPEAEAAVRSLSEGIDSIFDKVNSGAALDVIKIKKSVERMIDSVIRNPDACIWLARMKQEDQYTYKHSLGASIWAVALGRQLGLPRSDCVSSAVTTARATCSARLFPVMTLPSGCRTGKGFPRRADPNPSFQGVVWCRLGIGTVYGQDQPSRRRAQ
jgi:hypothetical protein